MSNRGVLQPDGTYCWKGAGCQRHAGKFRKSVAAVRNRNPFKPNPDRDLLREQWFRESQLEYGQWWTEVLASKPDREALPDGVLLDPEVVRVGLNGEDDSELFELNRAAMKMRMEASQEVFDRISGWQSSYEMVQAGLLEGRAGLNKLDYLVRTCGDPENPGNVHSNTLDHYEDLLKRRVKGLDAVFQEVESPERKRVLYRSLYVPDGDVSGFVDSHYKPGEVFTEKRYLSTSADSDYMLAYNNHLEGKQFVFEILTDRGVVLHDPVTEFEGSVDYMEREVLLPRGLTFKVVAVHENVKYEVSNPSAVTRRTRKAVPERFFTVVQLEQQ